MQDTLLPTHRCLRIALYLPKIKEANVQEEKREEEEKKEEGRAGLEGEGEISDAMSCAISVRVGSDAISVWVPMRSPRDLRCHLRCDLQIQSQCELSVGSVPYQSNCSAISDAISNATYTLARMP